MRYGDKVITNTVDITVSIWQVITDLKKNKTFVRANLHLFMQMSHYLIV